jgi:hypothetical protein
MRLGGEQVGRWGIALLAVTGIAGLLLAWHGWTGRAATVAPSLAGQAAPGGHASATPGAAGAASSPAAAPSSPASASSSPAASPVPSASHPAAGPLLSSEPYASASYQVWPGSPSAAAKQALTGLTVTVRKRGAGLLVTAGVIGQGAGQSHVYAGGSRVYVIEASLGDDSGNADYNLGDDGLVVTDARGRIVQ